MKLYFNDDYSRAREGTVNEIRILMAFSIKIILSSSSNEIQILITRFLLHAK